MHTSTKPGEERAVIGENCSTEAGRSVGTYTEAGIRGDTGTEAVEDEVVEEEEKGEEAEEEEAAFWFC